MGQKDKSESAHDNKVNRGERSRKVQNSRRKGRERKRKENRCNKRCDRGERVAL